MSSVPGAPEEGTSPPPTFQEVLAQYEEDKGKTWSKFTEADENELAERFFKEGEVRKEDLLTPLALRIYHATGGEERWGEPAPTEGKE